LFNDKTQRGPVLRDNVFAWRKVLKI